MKAWFKQFASAFAVASLLTVGVATAVEAKSYSRSSSFSSKPKSYSSGSRGVVSKPRYSAPKSVAPRKAVVSTPNRPAASVPRSSVSGSPARYRTPANASRPNNTTVIQKNYYGGNNGYRGNGGGYNGGGYGGGMGGGSGLGTSILGGAAGAVGGMMLYDALTEDEGEKSLKMQQEQKLVEEAKDQQARDDKLDQLVESQKEEKAAIEEVQQKTNLIPEPSDDFFKINPANQ